MDSFGPLSFEQEWLWLLDSAMSGLTAYNVPRAARITGSLDVASLERALTHVVERQAALRTTFRIGSDGNPVQVVSAAVAVPLTFEDLSAGSAEERAESLRRRLRELARTRLDLQQDHLLKATLLRLGAEEHVLSLLTHHIVSDGASREILFRELVASYTAFARGEHPVLPALPIRYTDYAAEQRARLQGPALDVAVEHWRTTLAGAPASLELPTDHPRTSAMTFEGAVHSVEVPAALAADVAATGQTLGITLHMLVLAAFQSLLHRYTGQEDIVVGCPVSGRNDDEIENLVGFFATVLPFRASLAGDPTFAELAAQVCDVCIEAYDHMEMPLEPLMRALQRDGRPAQAPLFQAIMVLEHDGAALPRMGDATVDVLPNAIEAAATDVALIVRAGPAGMRMGIQYRTDLWDAATAERMLGHMLTLLGAAARAPDTRIGALPLADAPERELLERWNDTAEPYPKGRGMHALVAEQAARTPDATAVVSGESRLSYRELEARAGALALRLRAMGVGPGTLVGVGAERATDTVVSMLGVLKSGAAYVPLDPAYPADRLQFVARDAALRVVIGRPEALAPLACIEGLTIVPPETACDAADADALAALPTSKGSDPLYVIYTSGSTGTPKGVLLSHDNIVASTWARVSYYAEPVGAYLLLSSFAFDSSVAGLYWTLVQGGTLVIPAEGAQLDATTLCALMEREKVTHLLALPSLYNVLLGEATDAQLASLRAAIVAAEPCAPAVVERHRARAPRAAFYNEYGLTETSVWCTVFGIAPDEPLRPVTIGSAIPNARLFVLDDRREPTPIGVPGELCVGGAVVAHGYLGHDALTAERFVEVRGERVYRTGDRVRWLANGEIEFLGRFDDQVKVRGYRIELGEVETTVAEHPLVREAVAITREDTPGDVRLVAYVTLADGADRVTATDDVRRALRERLPAYMVPAAIVVLDELPHMPNGKVDRRSLPDPDASAPVAEYVAPEGLAEETIASIMGDVLGVPRVGARDDFFALGGTSLQAMRLMARLGRAFDARLTWSMLFDASNVRALAQRVSDETARAVGGGASDAPIPVLPDGEDAPLTYAQELLWLLDRSTAGLNAYNVPMAFRVDGALDAGALSDALRGIVARHEPLRSTISVHGANGAARQHVGVVPDVPVAQVDLRGVPAERRELELELERRVREAIRVPFDITRDVLLRATVYQLDDARQCLLLVSHHIAFDEFSSNVVLRELKALYSAAFTGKAASLPVLPVRYRDYAAWQHEAIESGMLVPQLAYWRERLRDLPTLELPTMGSRPAAPRFDGARRRYVLPLALLERLRRLSAQHDATLYMTLLAAVKVLLHRYSGQDDIVVGSPITTRNRVELEGLIGYFPNIIVLRTALDGDPTFAELLARVRSTCLGGFAHQDVPYEKLALELRDAGRSTHDPLFQILFLLASRVEATHELDGALLRGMPVDFLTSKFDITIGMTDGEDGLGATLEYRTDLFDEATIDRMFGHLGMLLEGAVDEPSRPISAIPMLTDAERGQVVREWNATAREYPRDVTLPTLLAAQGARTPDAVAVEDAHETLTYAALDRRANQLAHRLLAAGVARGELVGIAAERSVEMVVGLLGVLKAGGAYVPIDPEYPADRVAFMLEDSGVRVVLTQRRFVDMIAVAAPRAERLLLDDPTTLARQPASEPVCVASAEDPAYMIYTSGSTGRPKGALNAHAGIVNRLLWMQDEYGLGAADVVLQKTPFSFDVSVWEFFWPLITGARLVMAQPGGHRDTGYLADAIAARGVTVCHFVPSMLRAFLANPAAAGCSSLRDVMASGEALAPDLVGAFHETLPSARLHNLYGPTECAVDVTYWPCPQSTVPPAVVPIGRPVANTQVYVLDARLEPVPIGVPGELYLAGRQVGLGYHGRPELTAERFVPDPFSAAIDARMYRTGDRARWRADGTVEYLGRLDFQVKVRGFRIELGEIEATLARHAEVRDVAVMSHDGGGDARLVAYVVPADQASAAATEEGVERWREVFDRTYANAEETGDAVEPGFNIAGRISSYDKRPIPAAEMREWVERTSDRILDLKPRRVLEIGCGTGLLLFRVAPQVEHYHGLDISATAIEGIRQDPALAPIGDRVTLAQARADETTDLPAGSFDTIVLSVVQYFPSAEYLVTVLERAVRLLAPGGTIVVVDVRLLPLLETLHTSVALFDAPDDLSITDLRARAQLRLWHESELVVDPAFFETLRLHLPRIADVEVLLKRGAAVNELTKFRVDVVLYADRARPPVPADATPARRIETLDDARALLRAEPAVLRLPDLLDARVAADLRARDLMTAAPAQGTVRELRADGAQPIGVDPEALTRLHPAYDVALLWPQSGTPGRFDAVLRHREKAPTVAGAPAPVRGVARPWSDFVHHPATESFSPEQVARWRSHLGATLPDYMVPSTFVRLSALPLTPSGKVDRRALRPPVVRRPSRAYVAPRTPTERAIVALWAEILGVERVGVEDGFLDVGGHSLLAMRVVGRVRSEMGISVRLDALVRGETAAQFAASIDAAREAPATDEDEFVLAPVSRDSFRRATVASGEIG